MNADDTDSIERYARVRPPAGHEGRVRARSGPGSHANVVPETSARALSVRWVLPIAAGMLAMVGVVWQSDRATRYVALDAPPLSPEWSGKGVDTPVLPPRAYWTMSALDEFEQLRGSAKSAGAMGPTRSTAVTRPDAEGPLATVAGHADAGPPWSPLPPITLDDIAPAPLEVPAISGLQPIVPDPIEIAPIDILPVDKE